MTSRFAPSKAPPIESFHIQDNDANEALGRADAVSALDARGDRLPLDGGWRFVGDHVDGLQQDGVEAELVEGAPYLALRVLRFGREKASRPLIESSPGVEKSNAYPSISRARLCLGPASP